MGGRLSTLRSDGSIFLIFIFLQFDLLLQLFLSAAPYIYTETACEVARHTVQRGRGRTSARPEKAAGQRKAFRRKKSFFSLPRVRLLEIKPHAVSFTVAFSSDVVALPPPPSPPTIPRAARRDFCESPCPPDTDRDAFKNGDRGASSSHQKRNWPSPDASSCCP